MRSILRDRSSVAAFHATRNGGTATVAANTGLVIPFNVVEGLFDVGSSSFVVPEAGFYHFAGQATADAAMTTSTALWQVRLNKNGAALKENRLRQPAMPGNGLRVSIAATLLARAGDYFQLIAQHDDTVAHGVFTGADGTWFSGHRVG